MLSPADILDLASRRWPAVLRAEAAGSKLFPLQIPFGRPRTTADFAVLQRDIAALAAAVLPWRIDWQDIQTRKWGRQRWPVRVGFESAENLAAALDRSTQLQKFREALRLTRDVCPALEPWLQLKADRILDHLEYWPGVVAVCRYFNDHPKPRCFPRQIPAQVGTKFIEEHSGVLRELLDVVVGDRVNHEASDFCDRFHLLTEAPQVRFKFLDEELQHGLNWPVAECTVPLPAFAAMIWSVDRVLVVENRDVFLCLPRIPRTVGVFGAGKAASLLPQCDWMTRTEIVYWGDCDESGYGILSALRVRFPQTRSVLMDDAAWALWKHLAIPGKRDPSVRHLHLNPAERAALNAAIAGPWMLEQEKIPPCEAERALLAAFP
jgi:hypothetical protein